MRLTRRCVFVVAALVLSVNGASAHHSFSAVYDDTRTISVTGVVTQFRFVNPHAMLYLDVTDDSGKVVRVGGRVRGTAESV